MEKINRNSPCPCGSGKKYKQCCLHNRTVKTTIYENDDYLPESINFNYGKAKPNSKFFKNYKVKEVSSFLLLEMSLAPNFYNLIEQFAEEANILKRSKKEANIIKKTDNLDDLIKIVQKGPDTLNHKILIDKILIYKNEALTKFLKIIKNDISDEALEFIIKIIFYSKIDCSNEIIELIINGTRRVYVISTLCFALGFFKNKKSVQILWDHFYYFYNNYPNESYADGPFIALQKIHNK